MSEKGYYGGIGISGRGKGDKRGYWEVKRVEVCYSLCMKMA
jgi:hypothetical protein